MQVADNHLAPYEPIRAQVAALKAENAKTTFVYSEPKGNKLARSHVASLRTVKGDIERKRKELKADALEYGRKVDSVAKELTGEVESMIEVHEKPLLEIESRQAALLASISRPLDPITSAAACAAIIERIAAVIVDEGLRAIKDASLTSLRTTLELLKKQEADAAELARLREAQAKLDAENCAKAEAEARARRDEEIRAGAEAKAKREAADAAMAEARKKEAEAQAAINAEKERTRKAELQVAKAKQEKAEAEARVAREEQEKRDAESKRAADVKYRAKVLAEVAEAIAELDAGDDFTAIALAIAAGKIPHVRMEF